MDTLLIDEAEAYPVENIDEQLSLYEEHLIHRCDPEECEWCKDAD